ncbi:MAG: D-alanine--D-alanine ligase [Planctomycetes bacterium]|nr:D-alanine--D-alanine ligase [Planctomycetota bacterium]
MRRLSVTVLAGGPSAERAVSLESGRAVAAALSKRGHEVYLSDISPDDLSALDHKADIVFPALHGTFGEDGAVQRIMERRGIRFVGSGSHASALAIDKIATKQQATAAGIVTPHCEVVAREQMPHGLPPWSGPVVVKPIREGSSVLTSIVLKEADYAAAVSEVIGKHGRAMIEDYVAGEEITVGLLGGEPLPAICIRPKQRFYDYKAKYLDDRTEYLFDTNHPPGVLEQARAQSKQVFELLGCRHLARADWIVDRDNRLWFLEINTLPGFTSHSLVPMAAAKAGLSFEMLVEKLVELAWEERA